MNGSYQIVIYGENKSQRSNLHHCIIIQPHFTPCREWFPIHKNRSLSFCTQIKLASISQSKTSTIKLQSNKFRITNLNVACLLEILWAGPSRDKSISTLCPFPDLPIEISLDLIRYLTIRPRKTAKVWLSNSPGHIPVIQSTSTFHRPTSFSSWRISLMFRRCCSLKITQYVSYIQLKHSNF